MKRQIKLKINTVFFIFILSAVYFFINRFISIPAREFMGIKWNFSQIPTLLFGFIQWIILVNYLQYFIPKKAVVQLNIAVFMAFFTDCMIIILHKTSPPNEFMPHIYYISHSLIKFFASGLIAVIASVYLRVTVNPNKIYIPEIDYSERNSVENYRPISPLWKRTFRILFYFFVLVSISLLIWGTYLTQFRSQYSHWLYKFSGISFFLSLSSIGFQVRWNLIRFQNLIPSKVYSVYLISLILAIWGLLFDFFTGFIYFLGGFFILITTHSGKDDSPVKALLLILNIILAALALVFHFMYSLGN